MGKRRHNDARPAEPIVVEPVILTTVEVAARWRVSVSTVRAAIRTGRLHAFKPDQRVFRISMDEVLRYEREEQNVKVAS